MKLNLFLSIGLLFLVCACYTGSKEDQERNQALSKEMKRMKIKRITENEVIDAANLLGAKLVKIASDSLLSALPGKEQSVDIDCQSIASLTGIRSINAKYGSEIGFLNSRDSTNVRLDAKERELVQAYTYNLKNGMPIGDNLQKISDTIFIYNAPVANKLPIWSPCVKQNNNQLLIWRIALSRDAIISSIN